MKTVAWVKRIYLEPSETFIYEPLLLMKRWRPVVLVQRMENIEAFPYEDIEAFEADGNGNLVASLFKRFNGSYGFNGFLRRNCLERGVRVLHAHFGPMGLAVMRAAKKLSLPLITTFYGYDVTMCTRSSRGLRRFQAMFSEGDLFLVEGPHMRRSLIGMGCPEEKIRLVHIGIDPCSYVFKPRSLRHGERLRILVAGRFVEKKGVEHAVRAAGRLAAGGLDFELCLVGDGPLRSNIEKAIEEERLGERVKLTGFLPHGGLREEIYSAHIGIVPSVTASNGDTEGGAPKTLLEMEASGLPVVATRHADIPYVAPEGKSAFLVDEGDSEGVARAVLKLVDEKEGWPDMGKAGSDHIRQNFTLAKVVESYESFYDELSAR